MFLVSEMQTFEMFSFPHIAVLVLFMASCLILVYFRTTLKPYQSFIKWTLFSMLILSEVTHHIWLVATSQWEIGSLPLQLCSLSTFMAIYLFLRPNKKVFYLLFFTGILPPILSMVTPELIYQFPHYRFIKYFLHHGAISWAVLYFIVYEGYRVPRKAVWNAFFLLNIIALPVFFINRILDTNFFYLANPTDSQTILSFFGSGIMYYLNLELAALLVFFITYLPMGMLIKRERKKNAY